MTTQAAGAGGPLGGGNAPVITTPIVGEQRRNWNVRENFAWNVDGTNVVPQPALAETRQLEIWLTPHGCLKAALAAGNNLMAVERTEQNKGRIVAVSFVALGKYRVQCGINGKNLVERVQTWLPNPVVGDLYHEIVYTNYRDFGGVMVPANFHAHHDLDDDLEGEGTNVSGGHNSFGLTVSNVRVNIPDAAPAIPDAVRTAKVPPVQVDVQKIGNGVFYMAGGTHASVVVEFRDQITVFDAPLDEARSLAVIREIKRAIPNKPIRYVVSSHHHWDHLGGLRAYVAKENVTIVLQKNNLPYYAEVLWIRPWTLQPDLLALFPPEEVVRGLHLRGGRPEVRAERRHAHDGGLQRAGTSARAGHGDGVPATGEDDLRGGSLYAAGAGCPDADHGHRVAPHVLQQRAAARARCADDCADPRRPHVPVGRVREVHHQRQAGDELITVRFREHSRPVRIPLNRYAAKPGITPR